MPADPADLAARMIEAAARAMAARYNHTADSITPDSMAELADHARAALAAAVREAGLDRDELEDAAHEAAEEAEREMLLGIGNHVLTGKVAALLRALAGIADAG